MDAIDYLIQRERMCQSFRFCRQCPFYNPSIDDKDVLCCTEKEGENPSKAVEIVKRWAESHQENNEITLTKEELGLFKIYIEKGYLWAARDKYGMLKLYTRHPDRGVESFTNPSPTVDSSRIVYGNQIFPAITWENSPVCIPKLIDKLINK